MHAPTTARPCTFIAALALLVACQSTATRLEDEWARFQDEYAATLTRVEALEARRTERAREGDLSAVHEALDPRESPTVRAVILSTFAGTAYEAGSIDDLRQAREELRALRAELDARAPAPAER